jgi:type II secretory pathway component PulF
MPEDRNAPILVTIAGMAIIAFLWYCGRFLSFARFTNRRKESAIILTRVREAIRLNLPLPAFLRAAALGEVGHLRDSLLQLESLLAQGADLPEAIIATTKLPARAQDLLRAATRTGQLPQTLSQLITEMRATLMADPASRVFFAWYPPALLLAISLVLWMIQSFVLPKYTYILHDFGLALPRSTRLVQYLSEFAPFVAMAVVIVTLLLEVRRATGTFQFTESSHGGFFGWLTGMVPFIGSAQRDRALADMLSVLADSVESGRPLDIALADAHAIRGDARLQYRFTKWSDALARGVPVAQAADEAGLPRLLVRTLSIAATTQNLPDGLRFLQRWYHARFSRTAIMLRAAALPVMVICMGCVVTLAGLALFEPLIGLMDILSKPSPGL